MRRGNRLLFVAALLGLLPAALSVRGEENSSASEIRVPAGASRSGDVVALAKSFFLEGELDGSAVLVGGPGASVAGHIRRDLILLGTSAKVRRGARIDGDVLALGGSLTFEENPPASSSDATRSSGWSHPQVGGRVRTISALEAAVVSELETSPASSLARWPFLLSFRLLLLFLWLVVTLVLLYAAPRALSDSARGIPGRSAFLGALGATAVLTAAFGGALALSVLPARVALLGGALALAALVAAKAWGLAALFLALGRRMNARAARGTALFGDPAAAALGLLALGALSLLPVVGPLLWGAASLVGIGVSVAGAGARAPRVVFAAS